MSSAETDAQGTSAPGQDGGDSEGPQKAKSEKERTRTPSMATAPKSVHILIHPVAVVAKERAKAEKAAKFAAKKAKQPAAPAKAKEKKPKDKEEVLAPYVEETPKGEKKSKLGGLFTHICVRPEQD